MGVALQVLSGRVTNPGATITAITMNTGDSNVVRMTNGNTPAWLENAWAMGATAGLIRVRSPKLHDVSQALRLRYNANNPTILLPDYLRQELYAQDTLIMEMTGGAAETDMFSILVSYDDTSGLNANLQSWDQISPLIVDVLGQENVITTSATAGQYGGSQAITTNFSVFKANTNYALLGYLTDTACGTIGFTGADFGNLRVGGPGSIRSELTSAWFVDLAQRTGKPFIPVFNSANAGNITIDIATPATAATINTTMICAELRSS
jgi:hypothetical protein